MEVKRSSDEVTSSPEWTGSQWGVEKRGGGSRCDARVARKASNHCASFSRHLCSLAISSSLASFLFLLLLLAPTFVSLHHPL